MAMHELQSELLQLLSSGKKKQGTIIKDIDKFVNEHGLRNLKKWRNIPNKKNTLLHELVERDMPDVIHHMVRGEHKFDINIRRDSDGLTPWQLASQLKDYKMCDFLKDLGAEEIYKVDASQLSLDEEKEKSMNIVWLDLEMTSFDEPEILECAVIITDKDLNKLARKNWVIRYDQEVLDKLADWHQKTFADTDNGGNGLFADVVKSKLTNDQVEEELLDLLKIHCVEKKCPLGGSSVHIDKEVLKLRMRKVHDFLHYRVIDVSSFQGIMRRWAPWMETQIKKQLSKKGQETVNHRAMDDIEWSIAFMKEIRPMFPAQQNNASNQKKNPSIGQHGNQLPKYQQEHESPAQHGSHNKRWPLPGVINQLVIRNNLAVGDKIQLYADEKRLLERLDHEQNFDVKMLKLNSDGQRIYDANPHLREVFMNRQQLRDYNEDFTFKNRCLKLSSKPNDINNSFIYEKNSTTEHWGQRKLLLVEIEFLTMYAANDKCLVVYAGAAPGSHISYLSHLFPQLDFDLFDINELAVTATDAIYIKRKKLDDERAKRYSNSNHDILFICNVRTFYPNSDNDKDLMIDMIDQMEWHKLMKPRASLLNFRLPHTSNKIEYLKGNLVIEPWASKRSMECRLIVEKEYELIRYDPVEFENALFRFHNDKRIRYYEHDMDDVNPEGLDHCYDCRAEIFILQEYLIKFKKMKKGADLRNRLAQLSSNISGEIVDKKRESCLGFVRTLNVIPKK